MAGSSIVKSSIAQYPGGSGGTAVIAGPAGRTGLFTVPLPELVEAACEQAEGTVAPGECERFFGSTECPALPERFPASIPSEPVRPAIAAADVRPLSGTEVTLGVFEPAGQGDLQAELAGFTQQTGVTVRLVEASLFLDSAIQDSERGNPPDLAYLPPAASWTWPPRAW